MKLDTKRHPAVPNFSVMKEFARSWTARKDGIATSLHFFWQDCTPRGLSILPLSSDECLMFKRRFLKEQYLDTSSGRPAFCCALHHWPKPMPIVWSCLWHLRFGFPFFCARLCQDQIEQPRSSGPLYAQHVCGGGLHNVPDSIKIMELDRFYLWHNTLRFTSLTR